VLRLCDLVVGEARHVAEQEGRLQIEGQPGDRAPDGGDRLRLLGGPVGGVEPAVHGKLGCAGAACAGTHLVNDPVPGDLEQPGRELRPEREARQALVDAEEHLLGQVLGETALAEGSAAQYLSPA